MKTKTMRAVGVDEHGPIETLHEAEVPVPSPGSDRVRVRMRASCANHADIEALAKIPYSVVWRMPGAGWPATCITLPSILPRLPYTTR